MANRAKLVIDPGHGGTAKIGGSSPNNASGYNGLLEKNLTLAVARLLRDRLAGDLDVILTRDSDTNVSLAARAAVAKDNNADLFLSIHFNGDKDPAVDGAETWVARDASTASRRFARSVLDQIVSASSIRDRGVREANFGVLLSSRHATDTAVCLAELCFLSNHEEADRLADQAYCGKLADALAAAVRTNVRVEARGLAAVLSMAAHAGGTSTVSRGAGISLLEPRFGQTTSGYTPSVGELERLYAGPLASRIMSVVDPDAVIRKGPPDFKATKKHIPQWTKVEVLSDDGDYCEVKGLDGTDYGWTKAGNLAVFYKDDPAFAGLTLTPATAITIQKSWPATRREVSATYNRLGGLIEAVAKDLSIDVEAVLAVWHVESGGVVHVPGRAVIRFENHVFFDVWGRSNTDTFDDHFQFGTRPPQTGDKCDKRYKCHKFRVNGTDPFEAVHNNDQNREYAAFELAVTLADEDSAVKCISIGGPQILGANYQILGYDTPTQMYDALQADEYAQVLGFFDFCRFVLPNAKLAEHIRNHSWEDFARTYNGSGQVTTYATKFSSAFTEATAAYATLSATTQALAARVLEDESGAPVNLVYDVELIPQPNKLACWAASMAMLVSYFKGKSIGPEALANEVDRSLRTSYGWDLLEEVKDHFGIRAIKLPSNYSFVPAPQQWHDWLKTYGPLWVTTIGAPSHAIVVHGISGDLTPSGTSMKILNPWDTRVSFDSDPIDFNPANEGYAYSRKYDVFASEFGNMSLGNYGDWRVLYIGKRAAESQSLEDADIRLQLTEEEIADGEEPNADPQAGAAAMALYSVPLTARVAYTLGRRKLGEADVQWAPDASSIDFRHIGVPISPDAFAFTPQLLEKLCECNRFDVSGFQDEVLFGLRACEIVESEKTGFVTSAQLVEAIPDHNDFRCVLGVWKRSTGEFNLFRASTVPNWHLMEGFRQGGKHANMLPTGRYLYTVGTHRKGTKSEVRGAFLQGASAVVLRTLDNLEYEIGDTWDAGSFGDNIHPARYDQRKSGPFFSSAGCQTLPGNTSAGSHTGLWGEFRVAAGLSPSSPSEENGRQFVYVMLTGREARLVGSLANPETLARLRFGSSGNEVVALQEELIRQKKLRGKASGTFDSCTKLAYLAWQQDRDSSTADGVVTPGDATALGTTMAGAAATVTQSLGWGRPQTVSLGAPSTDDVIQQYDQQQGTSYGSYSGYRATLINGTVFGKSASGVHPAFLKKLQDAEVAATAAIGGDPADIDWGVSSIGGFRAAEGWHGWGLAIDINYASSPYIMHERGEGKLDSELAPVYERIAQFQCSRPSVIPKDITQGSPGAARTGDLYDKLREESDAMVDYFTAMQDLDVLKSVIAGKPSNTDWTPITGSSNTPGAEEMQALMMSDYVTLSGRSGPAIAGKTYPSAKTVKRDDGKAADRPFAGDPTARGPEFGFLSIRREIVVALSAQGLRWGAIDFGGESGDVMHFDDGNGVMAGNIGRAKRAAKSAAEGTSQSLGLALEDSSCPADVAVDSNTALVFSAEAPLADQPDCDHKAVWTYVPDGRPEAFSVLMYLHGNDAAVTVDKANPGGRSPDWLNVPHPNLHQYVAGGPFAPGPKYELGKASQASSQRPFVLVPEVGMPPKGKDKFWSRSKAGRFETDSGTVSKLIDDCYAHLAALQYVSGSSTPPIARFFLAAHSGGGLPLGFAATSALALSTPTDLWLYDCTYGWGDDLYVKFCRHWKAWVDPAAGGTSPQDRLGNSAGSSRMVIVTTGDHDTTGHAVGILHTLQSAWKGPDGSKQPGLKAVRFTGGKLGPASGSKMPTDPDIVEIMEDASMADIHDLLQKFPIVYIHSTMEHDRIPLMYTPHLLSTAAVQ